MNRGRFFFHVFIKEVLAVDASEHHVIDIRLIFLFRILYHTRKVLITEYKSTTFFNILQIFQTKKMNEEPLFMCGSLFSFLAEYPNIDTAAMGFPAGWNHELLWNQ